ncbi:TRAP transporter small permease [Chelativorans intermedius]|uniref:TRAP transporter small permease protein n=1 Tax=Chelativorans intermedius TaxID=515947 RepID=A0ABV6D5S5_9HYPH|nr:TRAP transporter small permease [Chelativorans intermedius]MCT8997540.1 TRAP transporter small permease [Chelativorans intermedius]
MAKHVHTALVTFCRLAAGLSFAVLILAVLVQVLGRSVFASSPVWTEELTRFALLYLAAFAAGLSYRSGDLVNVDIICESLPGRLPVILRFVSALATAALCAALVLPAWHFTVIGNLQTSPALGWKMSFIHASVLVLLVLLLVFALLRAVAMLRGASDGRPVADLETPQ